MAYKAVDGNGVGMGLPAGGALHLESVEEVALLGILRPQVGDSATTSSGSLSLALERNQVRERTYPANSADSVSAYMLAIICPFNVSLLGVAVGGCGRCGDDKATTCSVFSR